MSGDWRRLHRVRGVSSGSPENHWVPWLIHKAKTEEPKTVLQQCQTGLTGEEHRSDQCATMQSGLSVASYITQEVRGWQPSLGTLVHLLSYFPFLFS
jgi:hypothetical protein